MVRTPRTPRTSGGLSLPLNTGIGKTEQRALHERWDTYEWAQSQLASMGFATRMEPKFRCPELTVEVLTTPDSNSYTQTYAELNAWFDYVSEKVAEVKTVILQTKNELTINESLIRKKIRNADAARKPSIQDVEDEINIDPHHGTLRLQLQKFTQLKELLSARMEVITRSLSLISRQVEIRKLELEQGGVQNNMPGRGNYPAGRRPPSM